MARKAIKKEPVAEKTMSNAMNGMDNGQLEPVSSGATQATVVDEDVVMHTDLTAANHRSGFAPSSADQIVNGASRISERHASVETTTQETQGGLEVLGRGVKELVQAVQSLRHLGVEDLVIPLPKIVVVGDQSTGKSSLIEGISEIKVPRKAGVCTRCPMEINLSENSNPGQRWECHISLFKKYMYEGRAHGRAEGATRHRPLGPWAAQDSEDTLFAITYDKDEVANLLEWAQLATLNPSSPYENYMPDSRSFKNDRINQVKFSPNVVRIDITGPDLPNLSFYDLPGVINVADVEAEGYVVDLVKNLVKEYIKADNCINLLAIPMTDDPSNSTASRIIREAKAEARTVGVLTKPDRVQQAESIDQWVSILGGTSFRLGHGYHIVKNNPDITVNHATARTQERQFFDTQHPWASTLKQFQHRFGTVKLQTALSRELTAQIQASLPHFTDQVSRKVEEIDRKLAALPEPPAGNLPLKILERILVFETEVQKHLEGGTMGYTFQLEWHDVVEHFRKVLVDSKPLLQQRDQGSSLYPTVEGSMQGTPTPSRRSAAILIDSDDDNNIIRSTLPNRSSTKKRPNGATTDGTPLKKSRMSDIPFYTPQRSPSKNSYSRSFYLNEISRYLKEAHIGLPGQIDPKATERMIKMSVSVWDEPLKDFLSSSITMCESLVSQQVKIALAKWQQTRLYSQAVDICGKFFDRVANQLRRVAASIYERELRKPVMFNREALTASNEKALLALKARRRDFLATKFLDENIDRTPTNGQAKTDRLSKVTDAQIGPDPYGQEVLAMSQVKGYYECAYSRFLDVICQAVLYELFDTCRNELSNIIKEELHIMEHDAHERCAVLLAVNPEQEQQRYQLLKEKDTLSQAQERLHGLAVTAAHGSGAGTL